MKENIVLAAAGVWIVTHDITVAYIGVPLNVLVACAIGAFCSFSFSEKVEPRSSMFGMFLTCWFMGGAITAVVNAVLVAWLKMTMTDGLQAGVGAITAFVSRFFLPWVVDVVRTGKWLSWVPFLNRGDKDR